MKCPTCVEEGERSRVEIRGRGSTMLGWYPGYDENGVLHEHNPNTFRTGYRCSRGHAWETKRKARCPAPGCNYGMEPGDPLCRLNWTDLDGTEGGHVEAYGHRLRVAYYGMDKWTWEVRKDRELVASGVVPMGNDSAPALEKARRRAEVVAAALGAEDIHR